MVAPLVLLAAGMLGTSILSAGWNIYDTTRRSDSAKSIYDYTSNFYQGAYDENNRFFADYLRKHHIEDRKIRYPYRAGYYYNLSGLYNSQYNLKSLEWNKQTSWVNGLLGVGRSGLMGYATSGLGDYYRGGGSVPPIYY